MGADRCMRADRRMGQVEKTAGEAKPAPRAVLGVGDGTLLTPPASTSSHPPCKELPPFCPPSPPALRSCRSQMLASRALLPPALLAFLGKCHLRGVCPDSLYLPPFSCPFCCHLLHGAVQAVLT